MRMTEQSEERRLWAEYQEAVSRADEAQRAYITALAEAHNAARAWKSAYVAEHVTPVLSREEAA